MPYAFWLFPQIKIQLTKDQSCTTKGIQKEKATNVESN